MTADIFQFQLYKGRKKKKEKEMDIFVKKMKNMPEFAYFKMIIDQYIHFASFDILKIIWQIKSEIKR